MKLDILTNQWIDMVFEGRNKKYGAYALRKDSPKSSLKALGFGALFFALAMAAPAIIDKLSSGSNDDEANSKKIVTVKLPPKQKKDDLIVPPPPPPPPPPQQSQTKFVKPVVAKAEEVVEDPPKIKEIEKSGAKEIKGDPDAPISIEKPGDGDAKVVEIDDNQLYNSAGIEVKPDYPGGMGNFGKFISNNFNVPEEEGLKGKVIVQFVVERDGSLTDIKVLRDIGFGTGAEAIRVLKKMPKWNAGEQNGKKVRCTFQLPISIQAPE